ncbi:MAG: hypothetical protein IPM92_05875 [Saprospiraceae bacterium]|nr:hypothetical protein [Saprospiraceae bacterium]
MKLKNLLFIAFIALSFNSFAQEYKNAIGLRAAWGWALTGKHFLNEKNAVEAIVNYRNYGAGVYDYNYFSLTGLYQTHSDIKSVDGLRWYWGFGAQLGSWGGDFYQFDLDDDGNFFLGVCGNLGLDYKFDGAPINLSVDWIPTFHFIGWGNGFNEEAGGFAIRYTF